MNFAYQVIKEQLQNISLIFRLSFFEVKGKYVMHYLGGLWQILTPIIRIAIYWLVFGLGIRGGAPIDGIPFIIWLISGLVPWMYINQTVSQTANSIYSKVNLVSKMNFPVSVLPTIKIVGNSFSLIPMLLITLLIILFRGIFPGLYLLQLVYYLFSLYMFLYALGILLATLTTIVRDVQNIVQSIMRMMVFILPVLWNVYSLPEIFVNILKLNPFFYLIEGFRNSLIGGQWFYEDLSYSFYFWTLTLLIMYIGSYLHIKFRANFVDYI